MNLSRCSVPGLLSRLIGSDFVRRACLLRSPDTLRTKRGQPLAVHEKVHQCECSTQVIVVLLQATEAYTHESEDALQNAKRMFHLGSNPGPWSDSFVVATRRPSAYIWSAARSCLGHAARRRPFSLEQGLQEARLTRGTEITYLRI